MTLYDRAQILPGRASVRSKSPGALWPIGSGPHYQKDGDGAYVLLEDDRAYLDMLCGLGAVSLGHQKPPHAVPPCGSLPYAHEVVAGEAVLEHVAPWGSRVRFVRTGSEATHGALMVAMNATDRPFFWRLHGSYHGWHEQWQETAECAWWFDVGEVPEGCGIAAVIIEPPRWEPFDIEWLRQVVDSARSAGALVIFDDMIWGGRHAFGGLTEWSGITPDLACFGKAFGNGSPVAFIVGNEALAEHGECISGTYSGDANCAQAVISTIEAYRERGVVEWMWARGRQLQEGLEQIGLRTEGHPVHQRIAFDSHDQGRDFSAAMRERGILWHPACTNLSRAHTKEDIERVLCAAREIKESALT